MLWLLQLIIGTFVTALIVSYYSRQYHTNKLLFEIKLKLGSDLIEAYPNVDSYLADSDNEHFLFHTINQLEFLGDDKINQVCQEFKADVENRAKILNELINLLRDDFKEYTKNPLPDYICALLKTLRMGSEKVRHKLTSSSSSS